MNKHLVKLEKSRFFVPKENHEDALKRVFSDDQKKLKVHSNSDGENDHLCRPTPFQTVEIILNSFGFTTFVSEDKSVWVRDFNDREMTSFEIRNMLDMLVAFSDGVPDSIIEINTNTYFKETLVVKNGKLINKNDLNSYFDINRYGLKRTPFEGLEFFDGENNFISTIEKGGE